MGIHYIRCMRFCLLVMVALTIVGCEINSSKDGLHIMFEGRANIYRSEVYFANQVVGKITSRQIGRGAVEMVTIALAPEFKKLIGQHWAFYAQNGRIFAARIASAGRGLNKEDKLCGFQSKAALNWFKFKTLLNDRVYKALLRSERLFRQFS